MRLRRCLLVFALVLVMPMLAVDYALAQSPVEAVKSEGVEKEKSVEPLPVPTPIVLMRKDEVYRSAYKDAYNILSAHNPCSSFFGGPTTAVEVLNGLVERLKTSRFNTTKLGITMSGQTQSVVNSRTGANYRLFEKAVINTGGPFYRRKTSVAEPAVPNVGSFKPNTREARVTILLHEMGHLVQGTNGNWLLPNDGEDDEMSGKNTATIEARCGEQIKELERKGAETISPAQKTEGEAKSPQKP